MVRISASPEADVFTPIPRLTSGEIVQSFPMLRYRKDYDQSVDRALWPPSQRCSSAASSHQQPGLIFRQLCNEPSLAIRGSSTYSSSSQGVHSRYLQRASRLLVVVL